MKTIINEYLNRKEKYVSFKNSLISLMYALIDENSIGTMHLITGRVKDEDSLRSKINRKGDKYNNISDITDIVGIRIISYLESQVDAVGAIIEKEFQVDKANSVDKRKQADNEFGYKSLHYVVSMSEARCAQTEYKRYDGLKFEIQIRSILQHSWAEIEHDLGYKSPTGIPHELKRNFSRLSALLETADIEFDRLKSALTEYAKQVPERIKAMPKDVEINVLSLESLYRTNEIIKEVETIIKKYVTKSEDETSSESYDQIIRGFNYLGLYTIGDLEEKLAIEKVRFIAFIDKLLESTLVDHTRTLISRIELSYFQLYLAAKEQDKMKFILYMTNSRPTLNVDFSETADRFIRVYASSISD